MPCPDHAQCTPDAARCLCDEAGHLVYLLPTDDPETAAGPARRFWAWKDGTCTTAAIHVDSTVEWFSEEPRDERFTCAEHIQVQTVMGKVGSRYVWTFDEAQRPLDSREYTGDNAQAFIVSRTYDARVNLLLRTEDGGYRSSDLADGVPEYTQRTTFDARDQPLTQETDEDGDGNPDRAVTYTYDDAGHLLTSAFDSYLGEALRGTADFVQRQTWRDGRIVENRRTTATTEPRWTPRLSLRRGARDA